MSALIRFFSADGVTPITAENLSPAKAGETQTAYKVGLQNVGDRALYPATTLVIGQVGDDPSNSMARIGLDTATLSCPWALAGVLGSTGAGGVWGGTGTYGWVVTAYNGTGQTGPSLEISVNVDDVTKKVTLTWAQVTGASGYKVYRTPTPGTYGASTLRATNVGVTNTTLVDDGSATSSGAPPAANTTGGAGPAYGTPPTLDVAPLSIGALPIGAEFFYWTNWVIPLGTPDGAAPKLFETAVQEA